MKWKAKDLFVFLFCFFITIQILFGCFNRTIKKEERGKKRKIRGLVFFFLLFALIKKRKKEQTNGNTEKIETFFVFE